VKFIDRATRRGGRNVGHGLQSCRTDIREVKVSHPTDAHPIVFVDTPGFDDPFSSDMEILSQIADWLVKT
jgi:GTPase Era involved in 16S rRNA processing